MSQEVYFIVAQDTAKHWFLKIGVSFNPIQREKMMQTGCPLKLELIASFEINNAMFYERKIHRILKKFRWRGEWFVFSPSCSKLTDRIMATLSSKQERESWTF